MISAARAVKEHLRDWWRGTKKGDLVSMAVVSDGSYGIDKGAVASRPVQCVGGFKIRAVKGLELGKEGEERVAETASDIQSEIQLCQSLISSTQYSLFKDQFVLAEEIQKKSEFLA